MGEGEEEDLFGISLEDLEQAETQMMHEGELHSWMDTLEEDLEGSALDEYEGDDNFWSDLSSAF